MPKESQGTIYITIYVYVYVLKYTLTRHMPILRLDSTFEKVSSPQDEMTGSAHVHNIISRYFEVISISDMTVDPFVKM